MARSTDLVPVDGCPACGGELASFSWIEEPLVRGGGYGAARMSTVRVCAWCGYESARQEAAIRPLRGRERVAGP